MYIDVTRQVVTEKVRLTDEAALDDQTTEDGDLFQWFKHQAAQGVVSAQVCNQTAQGVIIAHRYVTWRHRASSAHTYITRRRKASTAHRCASMYRCVIVSH